LDIDGGESDTRCGVLECLGPGGGDVYGQSEIGAEIGVDVEVAGFQSEDPPVEVEMAAECGFGGDGGGISDDGD